MPLAYHETALVQWLEVTGSIRGNSPSSFWGKAGTAWLPIFLPHDTSFSTPTEMNINQPSILRSILQSALLYEISVSLLPLKLGKVIQIIDEEYEVE